MTTPSAPKGETKYHDITTGRCPHCGSVGDDGFRYHRCQVMAEAELAAATERLGMVGKVLANWTDDLAKKTPCTLWMEGMEAGKAHCVKELAAALEVKP